MNVLNVWVGETGDYVIPDSILQQAAALNDGRIFRNDYRRRSAKFLRQWGRARDEEARMGQKLGEELRLLAELEKQHGFR